jgi:hypothetical protein
MSSAHTTMIKNSANLSGKSVNRRYEFISPLSTTSVPALVEAEYPGKNLSLGQSH